MNEDVLARSQNLNGYSTFVDKVKEYQAQGIGFKEAVVKAAEFGKAKPEERGIEKGKWEEKLITAREMLLKKLPIDIIADCTKLPIEEIRALSVSV